MSAKRGFANLSPERRKEIASMGGKKSRGGGYRYHRRTQIKDFQEGFSSATLLDRIKRRLK